MTCSVIHRIYSHPSGFIKRARQNSFRLLYAKILMMSFLSPRQDVAYQMRTKTKEECESHYMKNFINNPLFSSTLLSLRKTKDSRFAESAIPFKRQYTHHPPSVLCFLFAKVTEVWNSCLLAAPPPQP